MGKDYTVVVDATGGKKVVKSIIFSEGIGSVGKIIHLTDPRGLIADLIAAQRECDDYNNPKPVAKPRITKAPVPQPEWLQRQSRGIEKGSGWSVMIDGKLFAVVKHPGYKWSDRSGTQYGEVTYELHDKRAEQRYGGSMGRFMTLRSGGRPTKEELAKWKSFVDASDLAGKLVIE